MTTLLISTFFLYTLGWLATNKINKFSWIDVIWSLSIAAIGAYFYLTAQSQNTQLITLSILMALWSWRLVGHLWTRLKKHPGEDPRYKALRNWLGQGDKIKFLVVFWIQGALALLLTIPLFLPLSTAIKTNPDPLPFSYFLGLGLFFLSWVMEGLADKQLKDFRNKYAGQNLVCDVGLWRYSRHPNYFFEVMTWISFSLIGLRGFFDWEIIPPVVMYILINYVTGIPPAEASSLRSKGEAYRQYQSRTSRLIPWRPK